MALAAATDIVYVIQLSLSTWRENRFQTQLSPCLSLDYSEVSCSKRGLITGYLDNTLSILAQTHSSCAS
jgi:hypothetical protein